MLLLKFISKRILSGLLVIIGVVVFIFFLFNVLPVNSANMTLGQRADAASKKAIEREFRLHMPWYSRLVYYFNDLSPISINHLTDDSHPTWISPSQISFVKLFSVGKSTVVLKEPNLGRSFQSRRKVTEILAENFPPTAVLALCAILLASIVGIVLGVFAALKQYTFWDNAILFISNIGISQPSFFAGFIIAMVFGYYLGHITGLSPQGPLLWVDDNGNTVYVWRNLILPVFALGIRPIAIIAQLTRGSMLDVLSMDYVRTARAKGLNYYVVIFKHTLRNALNPVITSISGWLAALFTGAYFIEEVFNYNGLGSQTIFAIRNFDFPVVMGLSLFVAVVFVVMNILTDMLYALVDPRVRVQ
ncbi:MAG: transporter permease [Bacteroidetes bacterium]|nr:transporter permease [Bacteroidota bacterium]